MDKITIKGATKLLRCDEGWENVTNINPENPERRVEIDVENLSQVSDGYYTIAELYDHRITLFIALCKAKQGWVHQAGARNEVPDGYAKIVWRSKKHGDGNDAYEGWFIMGIGKEKGKQISYHLPLSRWDETEFAETLEQAPEWDGHTSFDVLERLKNL